MGNESRTEPVSMASSSRTATAWKRTPRMPGGAETTAAEKPDPAAFWLNQFHAVSAPLDLPADASAAGSGETTETESLAFELSAKQVATIDDVAARVGGGFEHWLLAAWSTLLFRYSGCEDFFVGCRVGETDRWLPVRMRLGPQMTAAEVVSSVGAGFAAIPDREGITLEWIRGVLGIEATDGRHPLFQVTFERAATTDTSSVQARGVPPDARLIWTRTAQGSVAARITYPKNRFIRTRVERMAGHLRAVLAGFAANPDGEVGLLSYLSAGEFDQIRRWNATEARHDEQANLASIFARQVMATPEATAVEFEETSLTYRALDLRTNRLARILQERGVKPGSIVAISMERSIEMIEAVLAVLKAGGAYVPIDPAYPEARRHYMLEDSRAVLVLTQSTLAPGFAGAATPLLCLDGADAEAIARTSDDPVQTPATGRDLGYLIYTSGSTGKPKGVAMPQRALTNLIAWQVARPDFVPGARVLQFSSLSFDVSFQELFSTWASGGTLVLVDDNTRRVASQLLEYIRENGVERIFLPFVALRGLCEAALASDSGGLSLREVYTAGEQLQVDQSLRAFFGRQSDCLLENQYGPTEAHVVTAHRLRGSPADWPTLPPIGTPIANTAIHILDRQMQPVPVGVPGELFIGGMCLADGYFGREDLTAEKFVRDPFSPDGKARLYRSGDLATRLENGDIVFHGRMDRQKKFRGYRIEPGEIAATLSSHADVAQAAVVIYEAEDTGPRLVAYYVLRDGATVEPIRLRDYLRENLPDYMVPTHFVRVDALPLTPSGKVDEKSLPEPEFDRSVLAADYMPPRNDTERRLAWIWGRLLGINRVGVHDDFFDLGGTSLLAVEMLNEVRREFGGDIPLGTLAQAPTIEALADVVGQKVQATEVWDSLVPIKPTGTKTPFFCVHGGAGNVGSFPLLARQLPEDQPFYGLQWDGLDGSRGHRSVESMAAHYLERVRSVQPHGPYLLGGHCIGGIIAIEMTHQLHAAGERVEQLIFFDSPNLSSSVFEREHAHSFWRETWAQSGGRKRRLLIWLCGQLGIRVRPEHREEHAILAAITAAWRYEVRLPEVPVFMVGTGIIDGASLGLNGHWRDGAFGWSPWFGENFEFHQVESGHNEVYYDSRTVKLLLKVLERVHARIGVRS